MAAISGQNKTCPDYVLALLIYRAVDIIMSYQITPEIALCQRLVVTATSSYLTEF
jgi:hypothetical protein